VIIEVQLFAVARQLAGAGKVELELPAGATVGQMRAALVAARPELAELVRHAAFSINADFADDTAGIPPQAEVACIPPVSGG